MASDYHGIKPVTPSDMKMAKNHLTSTRSLNNKKIVDHSNAIKQAAKMGNKMSVRYNIAHKQGHINDNKKIARSLNTLKNLGLRKQLTKVGVK